MHSNEDPVQPKKKETQDPIIFQALCSFSLQPSQPAQLSLMHLSFHLWPTPTCCAPMTALPVPSSNP